MANLRYEGEKMGAFDQKNLLLVPGGRLTGFMGKYQGV